MAALSGDFLPVASHLCFSLLRLQRLCHLQGCLSLKPVPNRLITPSISLVPPWLAVAAPTVQPGSPQAPARSPAQERRQWVILLPFSL